MPEFQLIRVSERGANTFIYVGTSVCCYKSLRLDGINVEIIMKFTSAVFMDLPKAFDISDHTLFFPNLRAMVYRLLFVLGSEVTDLCHMCCIYT